MKKVLGIVGVIVIIALIIFGWYLNKQTKVALVGNEVPPPPASELPPPPAVLPVKDVYLLASVPNSSSGALAVYKTDITSGKHELIFQTTGWGQVYGVVGNFVYYGKPSTSDSGFINQLVKRNLSTGSEQVLYKVKTIKAHITGVMSPDQKWIALTEVCAIECVQEPSPASVSTMLVGLDDGAIKNISSEKGKFYQGFKEVRQWLGAEKLLLDLGFEGTEGLLNHKSVYILDIPTGKISELVLDPYATQYKTSPDGTSVAYTTFNYNEVKKTFTSSLVIRGLDNSKQVLANSTTTAYTGLAWKDISTIAVQEVAVTEVEEGLGYYPKGNTAVGLWSVKQSRQDSLVTLGSGQNYVVGFSGDLLLTSEDIIKNNNYAGTVIYVVGPSDSKPKKLFESGSYVRLLP